MNIIDENKSKQNCMLLIITVSYIHGDQEECFEINQETQNLFSNYK